MTLLEFDKSTISQSDHLWWIACLLCEITGKRYVCYPMCCNSESISSIMAEHITMWCDLYFCRLPLRSRQCKWIKVIRGVEFSLSFHQIPSCHSHRKQTWIIDSVWSSSSCRKSSVFMWKLTSAYCPHCAGSGVSVVLYRCRHTAVTCFPFCPLGYMLLPWMIANSLSFDYRKYIISFANFEVTPAASYQFTHFTSLTLAWKSDSWYPLNRHCYLCIVNMRGFCYLYLTLEKCSFTSPLSSYQQHRLEQVAWGLFVLRVVIMIFVYLFVFFILWRVFSPHGSCLEYQ